MSNAPELLPCPFCGGEGHIRRDGCHDGFGTFAKVECGQCGASAREVYYSKGNDCPETYVTIRNHWNTRADLPPKVKPLEWQGAYGSAVTPWGSYDITDRFLPDDVEAYGWSFTSRGDWDESEESYLTVQDAKNAAQGDYEARVLACLEASHE